MDITKVRTLAGLILCLCLAFSVWPGLVLINRVYPLVLGLPFVMAALTAIFLAIGVVLFILETFESRARNIQTESTSKEEN